MPSHHSAAYNASPHKEVVYWTANKADQREIKKWLLKEVESDGGPFYASFLNWCCKEVDRLRNPQSQWPEPGSQERAQQVRAVLRKRPLDVREFIGIMEIYLHGPFKSGLKCGHIGKPHKADGKMITEGDKQLRQIVWTQDERIKMLVASGEPADSPKMQRKVDRARLEAMLLQEARERARQEREMEREEQERAQADWKPMKDAVGGVGDEIEVEDATTGMDFMEIGQKPAWEQKVADRTKE